MHVKEETEPSKTAEGTLADILKKHSSWASDEWLKKTHVQNGYVFLYWSQGTTVHETEVNIAEK